MIPDIGLMVGCYIIVRMVSFLSRRGDRQENAIVMILALIAIAVTLFGMGDLLFGHPELRSALPA